jgi:hypothetical protein
MKKVLFSLGGAVLLVALLTVPALAGSPFWQSDLNCSPPLPAGTRTPFAAILNPSGDLYVSKIFGLPNAGETFTCDITCFASGDTNSQPCETTDAAFTLPAQRIKAFATNANLGFPGVCADVFFALSGNMGTVCQEGFTAP